MAGGRLGVIWYEVEARTGKLLDAEREVTRSTDKMADQFDKVDNSSQQLGNGLSKLATIIKTVIAAQALRSAAEMVQRYQTMAERVQMATQSHEEYEMVQRRLQATADGTYRSLEEAQELYIRTADSLRSMGYELSQAVDIQDSMSYAFVTNATSADRAQAAISQFTKAVNTGRVSADQWETITSAIPSVINDIAAASNRSASEVRALGASGKLAARDLTEGLRRSLDESRAAADNMATDLIDASVRVRNAMTVMLVGLENQTGAIQSVTDGIIAASEAMLEFGSDAERMEQFLTAIQVAGTAVAAVYAGRLLMAIGGVTASFYQSTIAARARAAADVQLAQATAALAAQQLIQARAAEQAARGLSTHAVMAQQLAAAEANATRATTALATAQTAMAGTATIATRAVAGLRAAMTFLGGPAGVVLLAAGAIWQFSRASRDAAGDTDLLTKSVSELNKEQRALAQFKITDRLIELEREARNARASLDQFSRYEDQGKFAEAIAEQNVLLRAAQDETAELIKRRQQLANFNVPAPSNASGTPSSPGAPPPPDTGEASAAQKRLEAMRQEIELAKQVGAARDRLRAVQSLGAEATAEERAEAERLATELYNLERAHDAAKEAASEARQADEDAQAGRQANIDSIHSLEEALIQAGMSGTALAQRQAELALNEYATPDQIARVRELAAAIEEVNNKANLQQLAGQEDPMVAEQQRFEKRLENLRILEEEEVLSAHRIAQLKTEAETEHQAAMDALREESFRKQSTANELLMASLDHLGRAGTDALINIASGAGNTQEAFQMLGQAIMREAVGALVQMGISYVKSLIMGQTAQAAATAAGVAQAAVLATAWAPAAALASLASFGANSVPASAGIASTMGIAQGLALAGGKQYGGAIQPGKMHRINENGAPEIFNAANGRQYMMANTRGEVVSNADATRGAGGYMPPIINVFESERSGVQVSTSTDDQGRDVIDVVVQDIMTDGRIRDAIGSVTGTQYQGS